VYPELVEGARARLRTLFDVRDYPPVETVRAAFGFSWRYITFRVPETLVAIDRAMFEREREKAAQHWAEAAAAIQALLRANMVELVAHMVERLTPNADEKQKVFKGSTVSNLSEFLRDFDARNIVDDQELAAVVARARELLDGVDPSTLRDSGEVRAAVHSGFARIQRQLDVMVTNRPARRIILERPAVNAPSHSGQQVARVPQSVQQEQRVAA